jgi:23S rRNA (pseudouridine1915-N3)-methyltransferase
MKLKIFTIGKVKDRAIQELIEYYSKLISKYSKIELVSLNDKTESKLNLSLLEKYMENSYNIVLSEEGKEFTTLEFAKKLEGLNQNQPNVNFFIANAYGFELEVKTKANLVLSLSQMTTGHELAYAFLLEQLFRCLNLNAGGKYHK